MSNLETLESIDPDRSSNHLSRKLTKLLEARLDTDKDTLDALKDLSTFFTENNIKNRRNLRSEIEKRSLRVNEEFLESFRDVKEALDHLYEDVAAMNECCNDMMSRLQATKSQTHDLINETTKLQAESQKIQMKQEVTQAFLDTFHLKPEEIKILRGTRDGGLDKQFFEVLSKVKKIHNNCKALLRSSQQTAGIEIMEAMALQQEAAYERLYRWTQSECRLLNVESPEINPLLSQAMESLQDRPVLFKYSIDEYANARRAAIVRAFIDSLTRGGVSGTPRPIEMHSHDPLRYVGDMLAWLHQATASEKEILEAVLKKCSSKELENDIQVALAHITEGLCRPLKVRVEQVLIASEQGAVTLFKLGSVLKFYLHTIQQVIKTEAALLTTLEEMHTLSQKMFYNSLTCHCGKILEKIEMPPADLGPPEALKQTLTLLREVLSCQDACLVSVDDRQKDVPQILTTVIEPSLQMCHVSASKLASADMATYLANCIYLIHSTLMLFEYTDQHLEMLQAQMDAHLDTLVSEQASTIVGQLGLGALYTSLQDFQPKHGPLSSLPGCDALAIQAAVKKLDSFLSAPDSLTIPQSILLLSASLRQTLRKRSMELLCNAYTQIYEAVNLSSNNYMEPQLLLPRTPEQVRTLLL
ncbi:conserved oligomeric Golgi complex subunit 6-like [Argiope bruennichi]|uniref:Conserved oligomeric Golgi complex subunit 6 n=1 Tax=Argiope bruennichi TaxID=94029 RepID=A0A8T0E3U0_ARGBR|nr:conserved oligomeric Golgi complex subunit 6-like [Argiope bruennichi]KAF8763924.1 Conserved oligomeric Golgi complex subunit 6 like protein [Argiope bruennichi]